MKRGLLCLAVVAVCLFGAFMGTAGAQEVLRETFEPSDGTTASQLPRGWRHAHFQGSSRIEVVARLAEVDGRSALTFRSPATGSAFDTFFVPIDLSSIGDRAVRVSFDAKIEGEMSPLFLISSVAGAGNPAIKQRPPFTRDGQWHSYTLEYDVRGMPRQAVFEILIERKVQEGATLAIHNLVIEAVPLPALAVSVVSPASPYLVDGQQDQPVLLEVEAAEKVTLAVQIEQAGKGSLRAETFEVQGTERVAFPVAELPVGDYTLRFRCDAMNWEQTAPLRIVPAKPSSVLIRDHAIHVDGEPYFPIALFRTGDPIIERLKKEGSGELTREALFTKLTARGFNTVHYSWRPPPTDYLDDAHRHGLKVIAETNFELNEVPRLRNHPALLGYYYADEPLPSAARQLRSVYLRYREMDPYHPVMTAIDNESVGFAKQRFVDIALPDPYVIGSPTSKLTSIVPAVRSGATLLNGGDPRSSVWVVPQLFTANLSRLNGFEPTYEQLRANTYAGLVAGARGVFYFAYWTHEPLNNGMSGNPSRKYWYLPESQLWDRIAELNAELREIGPMIVSGQTVQLDVSQAEVVGCAWLKGDEVVVAIVNLVAEPIGNIRIGLPKPANTLTPLFSTAPTNADGDHINLELPGYGVAVFRGNVR